MVRLIIKNALTLLTIAVATETYAQNNVGALNEAELMIRRGNCDSAMQALQKIPAAEKETGKYYELMGRIYECKHNSEYADIYYEKAYKKGVVHEGWKPTNNNNTTGANMLKQEQDKIDRQTRSTKSSSENIDDIYYLGSLGYYSAVGGKKAINKHGICFSFSIGFPVANNKLLIDFTPAMGVIYGAPTAWYEPIKATGRPPGNMPGLLMGVESSVNYVLINTKKHTLAAGLTIGIQSWSFGTRFTGRDATEEITSTFISTGPRVAYYGWKHLYIAAEYMKLGIHQVHASLEGSTESVPVNLDQLRIDVGLRFDLYN